METFKPFGTFLASPALDSYIRYSNVVKVSRPKIPAFLLIVTQLSFSVLIESEHRDEVDLSYHAHESLAQHQCGAREIHIPIDRVQCCQACVYSAQRLGLETSSWTGVATLSFVCTVISLPSDPVIEADFDHTGKRGPPPPIV